MVAALVLFFAFAASITAIYLFTPIAIRIGLVDRPGGHKLHDDHVPLVGGFAIYLSLFLAWGVGPFLGLGTINSLFLAATGLLFTVGLADDRFQLSVRLRFAMQVAAALMLVYSNAVLQDLGRLLSAETLSLGLFAVPFTIVATIGTINAMNMIDGVDGLAGLVSLAILGLLLVVTFESAHSVQLLLVLCLTGAVGGFLLFNMRRRGRDRATIFMGDAGSTLLGFLFAYLFISLSQGDQRAMPPVTALWLFAVPLMDTLGVMLRRIWLGRSPFSADRGHLHHLLLDAGFRMRHAVVVIALIQLILGGIGLAAHYLGVPESITFGAFLAVFALYAYLIIRPWRAVPRLRTLHRGLDLTVKGARQVFVGNLDRDTAVADVRNLLHSSGMERPFEVYERPDHESGRPFVFAVVDAASTDEVKPLARALKRASRTIRDRNNRQDEALVIRQFVPRRKENDRRAEGQNGTAVERRRRERRANSSRLHTDPIRDSREADIDRAG